MKRRDRERRPARGAPRQPKHRILIVSEGKVTEREYLDAFRTWCRNPRVEVVYAKERGIPLTLVQIAVREKEQAEERARAEKDDNLAFDEVWCVHDIDKHPKLNETRQLAEANGIAMAVSNPCVELWLWLHLRESPGAQDHHAMQRLFGSLVPGYDKHIDAEALLRSYEKAKDRAVRLDKDAAEMGETGRNPTTGVYRLTEAIRGVGEG